MRKLLTIISFLIIPILLTGCINIRVSGKDGGVFKSVDKAETWEQKVFVERIKEKKIKTIANINVLEMFFHPHDSKTIYLTTREDGAWVTEDGGERWINIFSEKGQIRTLAPHPQSKNIIYLAKGQRLFKTTDKGENWQQVYLEIMPEQTITYVIVDYLDPDKIYIGISDGRLIRSIDSGKSWRILKDFKTYIKQILINKKDTRIIYVVTDKGLQKSTDLGASWEDLSDNLRAFHTEATNIKVVIFDQTLHDALVLASRYGILKSDDGGKTWQLLLLLLRPGTMPLYSLAMNPKDSQEIYYGTSRALYKSNNGGWSWTPKSLPTGRAASALLVNYDDPNVVYLGVKKIKK